MSSGLSNNIKGDFYVDGVPATGSGTIVRATGATISTPAITGGTIDNNVIGGSTAAAGSFTTGYFSTSVVAGVNAGTSFTLNGSAYTTYFQTDSNSSGDVFGYAATRHTDTASLGSIKGFLRSRGSHGSETVVQSGDVIGSIFWAGFDGTDYALGARIDAYVNGTPGSNDMPTELRISVSADGAQTPAEKVSIDENGMQLGAANARVTTIIDDDTMATASATTLATSESIKAYVDNTTSGFQWTEVTGTSQSASVNNGYVANNASLVTVTIPSTAAVGDTVAVVGKGAGLWKIAQNASQTIYNNSTSTTTGTGGSITATAQYNSIELICITANNDWVIRSHEGSLTFV